MARKVRSTAREPKALARDPIVFGPKRGGRKSAKKRHSVAEIRPEIPKRWAWHFETLSALREGLIQERKERLSEVAQPIEPHSMSLADSASDEFDHEIALSRLSVDQDALYEVEAAMKRILNGTYGICEETGRAIPAARLKVLPWTRFRKEAANRLERIGVISRARLGPLRSLREEASVALIESEATVDEPPLPTLNKLPPDAAEE